MKYILQCQQFNTQFLENIEKAEDTTNYNEINEDFKTQNNEISDMFTKQIEEIKNMKPCLSSLESVHKQNSDLLEPIQHLTDEVNNVFLLILFNNNYFN